MPLAKPAADWHDYLNHLQLLAAWLIPLELWLAKYSDGPQGEQQPAFIRYSRWIMQDLDEADIKVADRYTEAARWPTQENAAYRWGISYVIEGSQLGGEYLFNRLSTKLAPRKLAYLQHKYSGRWPAFLQTMAGNVMTSTEIDSACAGAVDAFDALLQQLPARE